MTVRRGFSLVEVMLATALLAAGIVLAFATLSNATIATERAEAAAQRQERLRAVQGFLRSQVEGALPLPFEPVDATGEVIVFEAEADTLRLVAAMPGYLSRGGPYLQTFRLVRGADGMRLEFVHQLLTPEGPLAPEREPEILLEGITQGRFEVRTLDDLGEPGPWTARWEDPSQIPKLVRLQLNLQDPRAQWPGLVAAPRLAQMPVASPGVQGSGSLRQGEQ